MTNSSTSEDRRTTGWLLDPDDRARLLAAFPPTYPNIVAHHVTLQSSHGAGDPPLPAAAHGQVVGRADDGAGVEALVVAIAGTTERPSGGHYHITWSLAEGRRAKESNDVIAARGWQELDGGHVKLVPAVLA